MDKDTIIYDLVKEVREEQKEMRVDVSDIKNVMTVNTLSLQEHMRRTDVLENLYISNVARIESLEEPKKVRELLLKRYLKVAGAITATFSLLAAIAKFKGWI